MTCRFITLCLGCGLFAAPAAWARHHNSSHCQVRMARRVVIDARPVQVGKNYAGYGNRVRLSVGEISADQLSANVFLDGSLVMSGVIGGTPGGSFLETELIGVLPGTTALDLVCGTGV